MEGVMFGIESRYRGPAARIVSWLSYECRGRSEDEWGSRIGPVLFSWFQSKAGVRVGR